MWLSSITTWSSSSPLRSSTALIIIPHESIPIIFLGGRFTMARRVFPTSSSGSYHLWIPLKMVRSVPVPSSSVNWRSFLLFGTATQSFTFTALKSDLQNVSKSTSSVRKSSTFTPLKSICEFGVKNGFPSLLSEDFESDTSRLLSVGKSLP